MPSVAPKHRPHHSPTSPPFSLSCGFGSFLNNIGHRLHNCGMGNDFEWEVIYTVVPDRKEPYCYAP